MRGLLIGLAMISSTTHAADYESEVSRYVLEPCMATIALYEEISKILIRSISLPQSPHTLFKTVAYK